MGKDQTEYTDDFAAGLELMWGQGFLSPGGAEEVGLIVQGLGLEVRGTKFGGRLTYLPRVRPKSACFPDTSPPLSAPPHSRQ
jgi:hypothetical protein